jgi:Fe2+ or Zn2+ uptake regulation protein
MLEILTKRQTTIAQFLAVSVDGLTAPDLIEKLKSSSEGTSQATLSRDLSALIKAG